MGRQALVIAIYAPIYAFSYSMNNRDLVDGVSGQKHFNEADDTKPII